MAEPFDGYSLGGLWVGEPTGAGHELVAADTADSPGGQAPLPDGGRHPVDMVEAVARGVDMFDCVLPTRNARKGTVFTSAAAWW